MTKTMKGLRLIGIAAVAICIHAQESAAQIVIDNTLTPQQLVEQVLLGDGVTATNITFTGSSAQIGTFNATNGVFPVAEGIVMSTGNVADVPGSGFDFISTGLNLPGNADLNVVSGFTTYDAAVLQFDFVAIGDSIQFNYIFASEEYPDYVNGTVNDAFGFFISGPGFNGPFANNGVNIALIPGTTTPVSINNVNAGEYAQYFFNNESGGPNGVAFNGRTTVLTALAAVQCGETYTIKLAIGDGGDGVFDSGVFLEARSFYSPPVEISIGSYINDLFTVPTLIEDCIGAQITFTRAPSPDSLAIAIDLGGTAVNGVNYTGIPDTVFFAPNQTDVTYYLQALDDGVVAPTLTIVIGYTAVTSCGFGIPVTEEIQLLDMNYPINVQLTSEFVGCGNGHGYYAVDATVVGGIPPYHYSWSNGEQTEDVNFAPLVATTYVLTVTDSCGNVQVEANILIPATSPAPAPTVQVSSDVTLACPGQGADITAIALGGTPPYTYSWTGGGQGSTVYVQPTDSTYVVVAVTDGCYPTPIRDTVYVHVVPYIAPTVLVSDTAIVCPGSDLLIDLTLEGGLSPFNVVWSNGLSNTSNILNLFETQDITVIATDFCGVPATATFNVQVPQYPPLVASLSTSSMPAVDTLTVCELWADTLTVSAVGGLPPYWNQWQGTLVNQVWPSNDSVEVRVNYDLPADSAVIETYSVTVNDQCGVSSVIQFVVKVISCDILQPSIFNPNSTHEGMMDFCGSTPQNNVFHMPCLNLYPGNKMTIIDRWGRKIYEQENYHLNPWDGGNNTTGVYFYVLEVPNRTDVIKGYFHLVR